MKIVGKIDAGKLLTLMPSTEMVNYLRQRRLALTGERIADLGRAMGIQPQQAVDLLAGRRPFTHKTINKLNEIDPEYELVPLIGVFRKK